MSVYNTLQSIALGNYSPKHEYKAGYKKWRNFPSPRPSKKVTDLVTRSGVRVEYFKPTDNPVSEHKLGTPLPEAPHYNSIQDIIVIPELKYWSNRHHYHKTVLHELIHSTGIPRRIGRVSMVNYHEDFNARAMEELTAEIGALLLLEHLKLPILEMSYNYIKHFLTQIHLGTNSLQLATKQAQEAVKYLTKGETQWNIQ